jgi:Tol biopolymer transport system component
LTADDNDGGRRDVYRTVDGQVSLVSRTGSAPVGASYRGVSDSGSRIAFATRAALLPADQDNGRSDVYLAEGSKLSLVTGRDTASYAGMTPDGKTVFFTTRQALAPEDRDGGALDIYAWSSGGTRLVSGGTGAQDVTFGAASADGKRVFFTTGESLTPTDADGGQQDVYVSAAGTLRLVSSGGNGARDAYFSGLTPKGTAVFMSRDSLTAGDRDGWLVDVYAATADGTVTLLTPGSPFSDALFRRLAPDGRTVYFETPEGLDPRDLDGKVDVYSAAVPGG